MNLDDFKIFVDSDKLLLAKQAKYFGTLGKKWSKLG